MGVEPGVSSEYSLYYSIAAGVGGAAVILVFLGIIILTHLVTECNSKHYYAQQEGTSAPVTREDDYLSSDEQ